jgi:hypothetical protein
MLLTGTAVSTEENGFFASAKCTPKTRDEAGLLRCTEPEVYLSNPDLAVLLDVVQ